MAYVAFVSTKGVTGYELDSDEKKTVSLTVRTDLTIRLRRKSTSRSADSLRKQPKPIRVLLAISGPCQCGPGLNLSP
nr:hypothetical protein [Tanacetum cinerariifolium]